MIHGIGRPDILRKEMPGKFEALEILLAGAERNKPFLLWQSPLIELPQNTPAMVLLVPDRDNILSQAED